MKSTPNEKEPRKVVNYLNSRYFNYATSHPLLISFSVWIIIVLALLLIEFKEGSISLVGEESYFILVKAQTASIINPIHFLLGILDKLVPLKVLSFIPILLGGLCILLFHKLANKLNFSSKKSLLFMTLVISSPPFIYSLISLSSGLFILTFLLLGTYLLFYEKKTTRIFSLFFFLLAMTFDLFSSFFALGLILMIFFYFKDQRKFLGISFLFCAMFLIIQLFVGVLNPFFEQTTRFSISTLISDLGSESGLSFFILLLALFAAIGGERKQRILALFCLPLLGYSLYIGRINLVAASIILFLAMEGLWMLTTKIWTYKNLKELTIYLIILGLLFSTITTIDRTQLLKPYSQEVEALQWIDHNSAPTSVVFSAKAEKEYVAYFAQRPFVSEFELTDQNINIMNATSVEETTLLLEKFNVSLIYIPESMKTVFPKDRGILFVLKSERFKWVHSYNGAEVWLFEKAAQSY